MFKDQRFLYFRTTIIFLGLFTFILILGFILEGSHLFGFTHESGLKDQLSFNINDPWRMAGITLISSLFVHFNTGHFLQNVVFFGWFGFLTEKILGWKNLIILVLFSHMATLILMGLVMSGEHKFLGASLAGIALVVFYGINKRKWVLLGFVLAILVVIPLVTEGDKYSTYAHLSAIIFSSLFYFMGQKLTWFKQT